jgi:hypothetical protein
LKHSNIFSLKVEAWAHTTSRAPPFLIQVLVPIKPFICVSGVSILPLSTIFIFDCGIVPTVWYFFVFYSFLLDRHPVIEAIFFLSDFEIRKKFNANFLTKSKSQLPVIMDR